MIDTKESGSTAGVAGDERARHRTYGVSGNGGWLTPAPGDDERDGPARTARGFFDRRWGIRIDAERVEHGQWLGDGCGGLAMAWAAELKPSRITATGTVDEDPAPGEPPGPLRSDFALESAVHRVHVVTVLSEYRTGPADGNGRRETIASGWSLVHGDSTLLADGATDHLEWWTERPICVPGAARAVPARSTSIEIDLVGRDGAGSPFAVSVAGRWSATGMIEASLLIDHNPRTPA